MAEISKVPAIRFKGFSDEWIESPFDEVVDFFSGLTYSPKDVVSNNGTFVLRSSNVKNGEIVNADDVFVNSEVVNCDNVKKGDIAVVVRNGSRSLIGKHAQIKREMKNTVIGAFMTGIRSKQPNFTNALLDTEQFNKEVEKNLGATINQITAGAFKRMSFSFPDADEQTQIGSYFQQLDKLISLHQAKVNKLTNLKKAMLEKMFPKQGADVPEIRFKGFAAAWEKKRFGDCVLIQRGGSPRPIENFITNDDNGINWIKIGDVSTTSRYITKTKEMIIPAGEKHSRRVYAGDLILSNSMSFGRPYIMAIEGCIHDGWLVIRDENKLFNLEYLLQLLSSDFMLKQYKALASGGVVINLNSELVQSTTVYIPKLDEQEKIGAYFQNLDKSITFHHTELEKLNNLKKACLEKMFV